MSVPFLTPATWRRALSPYGQQCPLCSEPITVYATHTATIATGCPHVEDLERLVGAAVRGGTLR